MANKSHAISAVQDNSLVLMLLFFTAVLFVLHFTVSVFNPGRFVSAEVQFLDRSASGMQLTPASCASNVQYYHGDLTATTDGKGYITRGGTTDYGAYSTILGRYVCVTNARDTTWSFFVPANTLTEYNQFRAAEPTDVTGY